MKEAHLKRRLTAIFSADVAGYSRLMEADEETTVRTLTHYREILADSIQKHGGSVVDSPGDNLLAQFTSVVNAVQCAKAVQKEIAACNAARTESRRMQFRIGINVGDVIQEKDRIYGDGVNIAARLEGLAEPGGICISRAVFEHIEGKLPYAYAFLGNRTVKNIVKPVGIYRVLLEAEGPDPRPPAPVRDGALRPRPVLWGVVVVVAIAVVVAAWQYQGWWTKPNSVPGQKQTTGLQGKPFVAVLPFDNMSDDPEQEYFSDGMTEEIITRLSTNPGIFVIARNSTFFYKDKSIPIRQIGQELSARYVVEGSVRKAGTRVRVTAQLIDATTEGHIWANTYEGEFKDIFNLQDEIAQQVVAALNIKSREAEQARAWRVPTENLTAYDTLLRGVSHFLRLTVAENALAKSNFKKAVALDPEYATAYVMLGYTHLMDFVFNTNRDIQKLEQAAGLARKALSLDEDSFLSHALLADIYRTEGRYEQAVLKARRALALNPNDPTAYRGLGNALNSLGRSGEAVEALQQAMRLDPHHAVYYSSDLAAAYRHLGKYDQAVTTLKEALTRNPDWFPTYFELVMNYMMVWSVAQRRDPTLLDQASDMTERMLMMDAYSLYGHFALPLVDLYQKQPDKALADAERLIDLAPDSADSYAIKAAVLISMGRGEDAAGIMAKAMQLNPDPPAWYLNTLATIYTLTGNEEEAIIAHKRVLESSPSHADAFNARLELTLLYVGLDQEKAARAEAKELLKLEPGFSVEIWGQRNPNINQKQVAQGMAGLRRAGLN